MIKDKYREETKKEPYCKDYSNPHGSYNDDYVHWLERQVKNNTCNECGKELDSGTVFCSYDCRMHYYR
jgi:hypothetical protein